MFHYSTWNHWSRTNRMTWFVWLGVEELDLAVFGREDRTLRGRCRALRPRCPYQNAHRDDCCFLAPAPRTSLMLLVRQGGEGWRERRGILYSILPPYPGRRSFVTKQTHYRIACLTCTIYSNKSPSWRCYFFPHRRLSIPLVLQLSRFESSFLFFSSLFHFFDQLVWYLLLSSFFLCICFYFTLLFFFHSFFWATYRRWFVVVLCYFFGVFFCSTWKIARETAFLPLTGRSHPLVRQQNTG